MGILVTSILYKQFNQSRELNISKEHPNELRKP
jgi:hypothetical protein